MNTIDRFYFKQNRSLNHLNKTFSSKVHSASTLPQIEVKEIVSKYSKIRLFYITKCEVIRLSFMHKSCKFDVDFKNVTKCF